MPLKIAAGRRSRRRRRRNNSHANNRVLTVLLDRTSPASTFSHFSYSWARALACFFRFIKIDYAIFIREVYATDWDCLHFASFLILTGSTTISVTVHASRVRCECVRVVGSRAHTAAAVFVDKKLNDHVCARFGTCSMSAPNVSRIFMQLVIYQSTSVPLLSRTVLKEFYWSFNGILRSRISIDTTLFII